MAYRRKRVARGYTVSMRRTTQARRSRVKGRRAFGNKRARMRVVTRRRKR